MFFISKLIVLYLEFLDVLCYYLIKIFLINESVKTYLIWITTDFIIHFV